MKCLNIRKLNNISILKTCYIIYLTSVFEKLLKLQFLYVPIIYLFFTNCMCTNYHSNFKFIFSNTKSINKIKPQMYIQDMG